MEIKHSILGALALAQFKCTDVVLPYTGCEIIYPNHDINQQKKVFKRMVTKSLRHNSGKRGPLSKPAPK